MLNLLLWAGILVFSLASFNYTYMIGSINRVFLGLYKAVPESSVIAYNDSGMGITPYFDMDLLKGVVAHYFEISLPSYVGKYYLFYGSYTAKDGYTCPDHCDQIVVTFHCQIGAVGRYEKSATFTLVKSHYE